MDGLTPRRAAAAAAAVLAAGLLWRAAAAWPDGDRAEPYAVPQEEYWLGSVLLLSEGVFSHSPGLSPTTARGPLYPAYLALAQAGERPSPRRARLANAAAGAAAAAAAAGLAAALVSPAAGLLAAALASLDPALVAGVRSLDVHGFYGLAILVLGAAAARWAERGGDDRSGLALGAALAASLLARSAHAAVLPLLAAAAFAWWGRRAPRRLAVPLLAAALLVLPWAARGRALTGRWSPLGASHGAYNLMAAAAGSDRAATIPEALALADAQEPGFADAWRDAPVEELDAALIGAAFRLIARGPLAYARGCARRLGAFFLPLLWLALPALWAAARPGAPRGLRAAGLVAASFAAYAAIGLGEGYRLGVEPLLAGLAGAGLAGALPANPAPRAWTAVLPGAALLAAPLLLVLAVLPGDLRAARAGGPRCAPPGPELAAFLEDGLREAGPGWYLARWNGTLAARPRTCAGLSAFAAGDAAGAARELAAAAEIAPLDPEIRVSLAVALGAAGRRAEARRACAEAERLAASGAGAENKRLLESIRSTRASLSR